MEIQIMVSNINKIQPVIRNIPENKEAGGKFKYLIVYGTRSNREGCNGVAMQPHRI